MNEPSPERVPLSETSKDECSRTRRAAHGRQAQTWLRRGGERGPPRRLFRRQGSCRRSPFSRSPRRSSHTAHTACVQLPALALQLESTSATSSSSQQPTTTSLRLAGQGQQQRGHARLFSRPLDLRPRGPPVRRRLGPVWPVPLRHLVARAEALRRPVAPDLAPRGRPRPRRRRVRPGRHGGLLLWMGWSQVRLRSRPHRRGRRGGARGDAAVGASARITDALSFPPRRCTSDTQCDFGRCSSIDGDEGVCVCVANFPTPTRARRLSGLGFHELTRSPPRSGGLGDPCDGPDGPDDSFCGGNLGCQPDVLHGRATCGGEGADCSFFGSYQSGSKPNHAACSSGASVALSPSRLARARARPQD